MKYRKKPVVIDALQLTEENFIECLGFVGEQAFDVCQDSGTGLNIKTLEGVMHASLGDFIIKGVNGEFYPCKPDIFEKTYEKVVY